MSDDKIPELETLELNADPPRYMSRVSVNTKQGVNWISHSACLIMGIKDGDSIFFLKDPKHEDDIYIGKYKPEWKENKVRGYVLCKKASNSLQFKSISFARFISSVVDASGFVKIHVPVSDQKFPYTELGHNAYVYPLVTKNHLITKLKS